MFSERWRSLEHIPIENVTTEVFKEFLTFFYLDTCNIDETTTLSMLDLAEMYQVPALKIYCDNYLSKTNILNIHNFLYFCNTVETYNLTAMKSMISIFLDDEYIDIIETNILLNATKENVLFLLSLERWNFDVENQLFEEVVFLKLLSFFIFILDLPMDRKLCRKATKLF